VQFVCIGAGAKKLYRNATPELAIIALGQVYHSHTTTTELAKNTIRANLAAPVPIGNESRRRRGGRHAEDTILTVMSGEQRLDLGAQSRVIATESVQQ
jgi:hypothetical protein